MGQMVDKYSNDFFRWGELYVSIRMANIVIARIGECTDITDFERRDFLGRAYFIRAYSYYTLMSMVLCLSFPIRLFLPMRV